MRDQYDPPWKEILGKLLPQVMRICNPEAYAGIDWTRGWKSLDKDLTKLLRRSDTKSRWADKLVEVSTRGGDPRLIYLHIEVQNVPELEFELRMFTTSYRIFDRFGKRVAHLAILGDEDPRWRPFSYGWKTWGTKMDFEFPHVKLWDYNERWDELEALAKTNPVAVVFMAHLKTKTTRHDPNGRYREKLRLIRFLYQSGYKRQEVIEVFRFIDWVMSLPANLETQLSTELEQLEEETKMQYVTTWERRGIEKGRKEGLKKGLQTGLLKGKAAVLDRQLTRRFGELPEWAEKRLDEASSDELDRWTELVLEADRLVDVFADP